MSSQDNLFGIEDMETPVVKSELDIEQSIIKLAKEFQGVVDDNDFKNCFIIVLFYRFISEHYKETIDNSLLFDNVTKLLDFNNNLLDFIKSVFNEIEKSSYLFEGLFDDFKGLDNKHIKLLFECIDKINISKKDDKDYFGFIFEYFLSFYSSNSRKYSGAFFTPVCISKLLARLVKFNGVGSALLSSSYRVYDPTCGSGTLLINTGKALKKEGYNVVLAGQEINSTSARLAKMNMIIHDLPADIKCGDTLLNPLHIEDFKFDVIVSNPPYSIKWAGSDNPDLIKDKRYSPAGVLAPKGKADFAFIMHSLYHLTDEGIYCGVVFPGILYRDGAEAKIRMYLVENNFVDCIIQLPSNLFYSTQISVCIMILKKNRKRKEVLFVDASNECIKDGKFNTLTDENIEHIVRYIWKETNYKSKYISNDIIKKNRYNLSVTQYVEQEDKKEKIDIVALNREIRELHARNEANFQKLEAMVRELNDLLGIKDE